MRINLGHIKKGIKPIEFLQIKNPTKIKCEEGKILSLYSGLIKLKLSMYYTPFIGAFEGIAILKSKYKYLDLSKIDEAINEARKKIYKTDYLNIYLDYVSNKCLRLNSECY